MLQEYFPKIREYESQKAINYANSLKILRKILVYLVLMTRVTRTFLYFKTKMKLLSAELHGVENLIKFCNSNPYDPIKFRLPIDFKLLDLSIEQLINLIDIRDITAYILLARMEIKPRGTSPVMIRYKGQVLNFSISEKERVDILCGKFKQRDDLIKLAFDLIRRELLVDFKKNVMHKTNNFKIGLVRRCFVNEYFQNDPDAREFMTTATLPQPLPKIFDGFPKLKNLIRHFRKGSFFERMINQMVFQGRELKKWDASISFEDYYMKVFLRHFYGGYVLLDFVNSLKYFCSFFKF